MEKAIFNCMGPSYDGVLKGKVVGVVPAPGVLGKRKIVDLDTGQEIVGLFLPIGQAFSPDEDPWLLPLSQETEALEPASPDPSECTCPTNHPFLSSGHFPECPFPRYKVPR